MFQDEKGFIKENLLFVVEVIGETLPTKATISKLKDIILKSKEYSEDPDVVASILITAVADRKQKVDEKKNVKKRNENSNLNWNTQKEREQFTKIIPCNLFVSK
ncbi:hypothetical protein AVEN_157434-1 [Araneus ventricosus]|uniref:Uncharacterized protein n=1 Tax=Araneus ventricosus TaxID=182803 RepID=A0A4Y2KBX3_ARAVE|nr:hypothetical protein AVEN_157434-1 [Araneus ventricosus]